MSRYLELAERVEALTGPDREVDAQIGAALQRSRVIASGYSGESISADAKNPGHICESVGSGWWAPCYTASLDAAMYLVPDGWGWNISWPNIKARTSGILREDAPCQGEVQLGGDQRYIVAAATPALALTAASLRALHAIEASKEMGA